MVDPGRAQFTLDRLLFGATVALYRVGPKDARLEIHGACIAEFDYVRAGWAGMIEGGLDLRHAKDLLPRRVVGGDRQRRRVQDHVGLTRAR